MPTLQSSVQLPPAGNIVTNSTVTAALACAVTLPAAVGKYTYCEGFTITGTGATGIAAVNAVLSGIAVNCTYVVVFPANINAAIDTLDIRFPTPIPSSAQNTAITLTVPNCGGGNTNVCATIYGYQGNPT